MTSVLVYTSSTAANARRERIRKAKKAVLIARLREAQAAHEETCDCRMEYDYCEDYPRIKG